MALIFATWDAQVPKLKDWLGDMAGYLDIIVNRTGGIEIIGTPQIWDVDCSVEFAVDNFTDNVHVFSGHQSLVQLGMLPNDPGLRVPRQHDHGLEMAHILHFVKGVRVRRRSLPVPGTAERYVAAVRQEPEASTKANRRRARHQRGYGLAEFPLAAIGHQRRDEWSSPCLSQFAPRTAPGSHAHADVFVARDR